MFHTPKIQNVSNFYFKKGAAKKHKFATFLKSCYFVRGGMNMNIDMNIGMLTNFCGLPRKCNFANFPKI